MPAKLTRFEQARKTFADAGPDTASRTRWLACGTIKRDGSACVAQGLYTESYRGTAYHFEGRCKAGHVTERFGYADGPVTQASLEGRT